MPASGNTDGRDVRVDADPTPASDTQPQVDPPLPNMEDVAASVCSHAAQTSPSIVNDASALHLPT